MLTFSLQSGSNGNSIYVEAAGTRLLFDAGISGRQARQRMAEHGRDIRDVDALIVSHGHLDHIRSAGIFQRLFQFPLYISPETHRRARSRLGKMSDVRHYEPGDSIAVNGVTIHTIPTPHDAPESVAFIVEAEGKRLGIFTDLGHSFAGLLDALRGVDATYLESNYDEEMLESGPYPADLKARIRGDGGHISNAESADLVDASRSGRPKWIALAHLSSENNDPQTALRTHRKRVGDDFPIFVAGRYRVSEVLNVS